MEKKGTRLALGMQIVMIHAPACAHGCGGEHIIGEDQDERHGFNNMAAINRFQSYQQCSSALAVTPIVLSASPLIPSLKAII